MTLTLTQSKQASQTVDPAAVATRAIWGRQRDQFSAGTLLRARSEGLAALVTATHPGKYDATHVAFLRGAGAAGGASAYSYTMPATAPALPTTSDITTAANYANAVMLAYAPGDRENAVLVPRVATGGGNLAAGPFWRVTNATTISTVGGGSTGAFTDWPADYVLEIVLPTNIAAAFTAAAAKEDAFTGGDFYVADATTDYLAVTITRTRAT